jgi:bifunctional non-homologous end joining protein LigD
VQLQIWGASGVQRVRKVAVEPKRCRSHVCAGPRRGRWVHDELQRFEIPHVLKTSGASGLHVYVPLPPGTSNELARLFCQIIATLVAHEHPQQATVVRNVHSRGRRVYIDYLQNIRGKTLATAYSARASAFAGVSAPLTWQELEDGATPQDFTMRTMPRRIQVVGDLWAALRESSGANLATVVER